MRNPKRLAVLECAMGLAVDVYRLTNGFPPSERFGLSTQMRRAAVSVGSDIAEGYGRSGDRELLHYLSISRGSTAELSFQLDLAHALGFATSETCATIDERIDHVQRMLNRLSTRVRAKIGAQ